MLKVESRYRNIVKRWHVFLLFQMHRKLPCQGLQGFLNAILFKGKLCEPFCHRLPGCYAPELNAEAADFRIDKSCRGSSALCQQDQSRGISTLR